MKIINLLLIIISSIIISCSTDLNIDHIIDLEKPFKLTIQPDKNQIFLGEIKTTELKINSIKWRKLIEWATINRNGWKSTPASYLGNTYIVQDNFKLNYRRNSKSIIISFSDSDGKPQQYIKDINKNELNFLYNK